MDYDWEGPVRARHPRGVRHLLVVFIILMLIDLGVSVFVVIPCLRSLMVRQNNVEAHTTSLKKDEVDSQKRIANLEREMRLLNQDVRVLENINNGDYCPRKE